MDSTTLLLYRIVLVSVAWLALCAGVALILRGASRAGIQIALPKDLLLTLYHGALVLACAYTAQHAEWAWAAAALTSLAGLSQAPQWTTKSVVEALKKVNGAPAPKEGV